MSIKIGIGDSVSWITGKNPMYIKNTTSEEFIDGTISLENPVFTHVYNSVGTFEYMTLSHPWMKGEVVVREFSAEGFYHINFTTPNVILPSESIIEELPGTVPD